MSPVQSADTLRVQNFVEIALSHTVSEMNALLRFTQKYKMAAKSGGKVSFAKNFDKIALSRTVKEIEANLCVFPFMAKIRKWPPFLKRVKFFENCKWYIS